MNAITWTCLPGTGPDIPHCSTAWSPTLSRHTDSLQQGGKGKVNIDRNRWKEGVATIIVQKQLNFIFTGTYGTGTYTVPNIVHTIYATGKNECSANG